MTHSGRPLARPAPPGRAADGTDGSERLSDTAKPSAPLSELAGEALPGSTIDLCVRQHRVAPVFV